MNLASKIEEINSKIISTPAITPPDDAIIVAVHKIDLPGQFLRLLYEDQRGNIYEVVDQDNSTNGLGITFVGKLLRGAVSVVKTVAGAVTGGGGGKVETTPVYVPAPAAAPIIIPPAAPPPPQPTSNNWMLPVGIGVGLLILTGGVVFVATRPKSKALDGILEKKEKNRPGK